MVEKQYDWFAALVQNPDLMISDFKRLGVNPDNSDFKQRSEYEGLPQVQSMFKDTDGNFDKAAFDKFYDNALLLYNNYANEEYVPKATELFGYLDSEWDRPANSKIWDTTPRFTLENTPQTQSFGIDYINRSGEGPFARQSVREIAQQQKVVDFETGKELNWTPDDKTGLLDALVRPTLVLATYDKDEDETLANGEIVHHKKGEYKFRNGLPYYETLGDRSITGKQVLAYSDSLTREGSWLNKYDFFDSDGLDKSLVGTVAKTVTMTLPYLIPGVGEILGGATAFLALNRVLPVLGKAIEGIAGSDGRDEFSKKMNQYEGWFAKFDPSVSDRSQEHMVTFENLGSLISSVSGQLFQQKMVGAIPMLLNKSGDIAKNAQWGRYLAYGYMGLTSAQESYDVFKQAGASDTVAGWAFIANMIALNGLMATDYGKGLLFKGTWLDENYLKEPAIKAANEVRTKLTEGIENATSKEKAKFIQGIINIYNKHFSSAAANTVVNRGLSEALEETMEEGIIDITKAITSVAESIGINVGEQKLDFGWSWNDVLQRYGMAAAGGFVGGSIFHLQGKWDKFLANDMAQHTDEDTLKKLTYYIAQGRGAEIRDYYRQWHKRGLLGSTSLGTNLTTISSIDGKETISEPAGNNLSQNDVVFNTMMKCIDSIEDTISKEGLLIDTGTIVRDALNGYRESDKSLRGDTLINLGVHDLLINDIYSVAAKIVSKNAELQSEINKLTVAGDTSEAKQETDENIKSSEKVKKLQSELDELRTERDRILNGELNWKYIGQAIFASNTGLAKNFIDLSIENYTQAVHGQKYSALNEEQQKAIKTEWDEYMKDEGKNKILRAFDVYLGLSQRYAERLKAEQENLKDQKIDDIHKSATEYQTVLVNLSNDSYKAITELRGLIAKEDKTDADVARQAELEKTIKELEGKQKELFLSPYTLLLHPIKDNDEIISGIISGAVSPEDEANLFAKIRDMYLDYANSQRQLNSDAEYNAALMLIGRKYNDAADPKTRVQAWLDNLIYSQTANGEDNALWTGYIMENNLEDILPDDPEDQDTWDTDFIKNITRIATDLVSNLGVNDKIVVDSYNELISELQRSGIPQEDIDSLLKELIPTYFDGVKERSIVEYIGEIDGIRSNIKYSSFVNLLKDFSTDLLGDEQNILDLINSEKLKLANVQSLDKYLITDPAIKDELDSAKQLIGILKSVIKGSVDKTNSSINSDKSNPIPLAELDEKTGRILYGQAVELENEIESLLDIASVNGARILKVHEEIDSHMRARFIWTMLNSPAFVEQFGQIFYTEDASHNRTPIRLNELVQIPEGIDLKSPELSDPSLITQFEVAFETALFNAVNESTIAKDTIAIAKGLVSLFGNDTWKMELTKLDTTTEIITPYSMLNYLQLVVSAPADAFYTKYREVTTDDNSPFAPIYSQEMAIRHVVAAVARPDLVNAILDELGKKIDTSHIDPKDKATINWMQNLAALYNFVMIPGGAGCGKTEAVAHNVAKMYEDYDHEFICLAPEKEQTEKLAKAVGENIQHFDKSTFLKNIFGIENQQYRKNASTNHFEMTSISVEKENLFDANKKLKMLFIDEVSLFTEAELKLITKYAKDHGIIIVGLGDNIQNSAKVFTDEILTEGGVIEKESSKSWHSTGLEDCRYFGSSYLTATLRATNEAKYKNFDTFNRSLSEIMDKWNEKRELTFADLDQFVPSIISIKYYETGDTIFGEKIVNEDNDLKELINKYKNKGEVAVITDDISKYTGITGVKIVPYHKMQGMETDYVFVDVDFAKNNTFGNGVSKYALLRDLYTISQRSRVASIIKDRGISKNLSITNDKSPEFGRPRTMNEEDKVTFKARRNEILRTLPENNNFYDFIYNFKSVPITSAVTAKSETSSNPTELSSTSTSSNVGINPPAPTGSGPEPSTPSGNPGIPTPAPGLTPNPVSQGAQTMFNRGSSIVNNAEFYTYLQDINFRTTEASNPNSILSWKNGQEEKAIKIPNETYKNIIRYLASGIRTGKSVNIDVLLRQIIDFSENSDKDSATNLVSKLKSVLSQTPDIYISEYDNKKRIITAMYKDGDKFIQIPIGFTRTSAVGRYTGSFERNKNLAITHTHTWIDLEEFQRLHPEVIITPDWGVLIKEVSGINKRTEKFIKGNRNYGKVFIVFTDEPANMDFLFDWHHRLPGDEYVVSHYKDLALAGIQKPINPINIVQFVQALHGKNNNIDLQKTLENGIYEDYDRNNVDFLLGVDLESLPSGADYYKVINSRAWQVLPKDRMEIFIRATLENVPKDTKLYQTLIWNLSQFLNHKHTPNDRVSDEKHAMVLSEGDRAYYVRTVLENGVVSGFEAFPWYDGSFDNSQRTFIKTDGKLVPYSQICQQLFGKDAVRTSLWRDVTYVSNTSAFQELSPNDNLWVLFGNAKIDSDLLQQAVWKDDSFVNGVYIQDTAGDLYESTSAWRRFTGNKIGYLIDTEFEHTLWSIDENQIITADTQPNPISDIIKEFDSMFNEILDKIPTDNYKSVWKSRYSKGIELIKSGNSIENTLEILINGQNNNMAFTQNDWFGYKIVYSDNGYSVIKSNNFDTWLDRRVKSLMRAQGIMVNDNANVSIENNQLNTWKYGIISVTSQDGSIQHGVLRLIGDRTGYEFELMHNSSYEAYKILNEIINTLGNTIDPIKPYLNSVYFKYTNSAKINPVKAAQWLENNGSEQLKSALYNYLEQRIKNNEC